MEFAFLKQLFSAFMAIIMALPQVFTALGGTNPETHVRRDGKAPTVFVGGLTSYGEQSGIWYIFPLFGIRQNVPKKLEDYGYECYVSSTGTLNSSWDRCCNLYAELTGTRADYGEAHAKAHGHARYGRDYGKLLEDWGPDRPVNLIGHSGGGPVVNHFAHLLAEGCADERAATADGSLSPLFAGGHANLVHSVTSLSGPVNGVSYGARFLFFRNDIFGHDATILAGLELPGITLFGNTLLFQQVRARDIPNYIMTRDHALYDLTPGGAAEINMATAASADIYYFSYVTCDTTYNENTGRWRISPHNLFTMLAWPPYFPSFVGPVLFILGWLMSSRLYDGVRVYPSLDGDFQIDGTWHRNDGFVNTNTSMYPFGAPHKDFDPQRIEKGTWQVFPVMEGHNHFYFAGFDYRHTGDELLDFFLGHLAMLDTTYE